MFGTLLMTSIVTGLLGTAVMIVVLYLPVLWNGMYYDTLAAIGSIWTRTIDLRTRMIGALILFAGGILFAMFYGSFALMFLIGAGAYSAPTYRILPSVVTSVDLFYPFIGLIGGFGQGIFMSLITSFIVTDFHPMPQFRDEIYPLIVSFLVGHMVFGAVVMFFQHQLLQLLI